MARWIMKSEPDEYSWEDLVKDGKTEWTGVRNHQAANFLRAMTEGDEAFFYHSRTGLEAVGIMRVARGPQPDGDDGKWVSVLVEPVCPLAQPVTLKQMKATKALSGMQFLRQSRLSVAPVSEAEWDIISGLAAGSS